MGEGAPRRSTRGTSGLSRLLPAVALAAVLALPAPASAWTIIRDRTDPAKGVTVKERGRRCGASKLGVYRWTSTGRRAGKAFVLRWNEYVIRADGRFRNLHQTYVGGPYFSSLPNKSRRATIAAVFDATNATSVALLKSGKSLRYRHAGSRDHTLPFRPRAGC